MNKLKESRNKNKVDDFLKKIEQAAKDESKNLLEICIQAAKNKCTVGEMTSAMENVFGRHTLSTKKL